MRPCTSRLPRRLLAIVPGLALSLVLARPGTAQPAGARAGAGEEPTQEDAATEPPASPEERLLRAELAEVTAGDLERAAALYRGIVEDEAAGAVLRAEARLGLARIHRKRGELAAARRALEQLVANDALGAGLRRRAETYLDELETGEPTEPRFDWIAELQRNPEIQARIFEDIMALVEDDTATPAAGRLLALGPVAVPMLEQAAGRTADPEHRQRIAILLVQLGRTEHLEAALGSGTPGVPTNRLYADLVRAVARKDEAANARLRDALRELEPGNEAALRASGLALAAGATGDLAEHLDRAVRLVRLPNLPPGNPLLHTLGEALLAREAGRRALIERLREPDARIPWTWVEALEPDLAPRGLLAALAQIPWPAPEDQVNPDTVQRADGLVRRLVEHHGLEAVMQLDSPENILPWLLWWLRAHHDEDGRIAEADPAWATVLGTAWRTLRTGPIASRPSTTTPDDRVRPSVSHPAAAETRNVFRLARRLAETHDAAVGVWIEILREAGEVPAVHEEVPAFDRDAAVGVWIEILGEAAEVPTFHEEVPAFDRDAASWRPSPAYTAALAEVVGTASDPVVLGIALEALALAPPDTPDVLPRLRAIAREHPDGHVREMALYAAIRRIPSFPGTVSGVAALLEADWKARAGEPHDASFWTSPWAGVGERGHLHVRTYGETRTSRTRGVRWRTRAAFKAWRWRGTRVDPDWGPFTWALEAAGAEALRPLHRPLLETAVQHAELRGLYAWFFATWESSSRTPEHTVPLTERLELLSRDARRLGDSARPFLGWVVVESPLLEVPRGDDVWERVTGGELLPELFEALVAVVLDPAVPLATRTELLEKLGPRALAAIDWPSFLARDDPLANAAFDELRGATQPLLQPYGLAPEPGRRRSVRGSRRPAPEPPERFPPPGVEDSQVPVGASTFRDAVLAGLECPRPEVREEAAELLRAVVPDPAQRAARLAAMAGDPDPGVFQAVGQQLFITGVPEAVQPILEHFVHVPRERADASGGFLNWAPGQLDRFDTASRRRLLEAFLASPHPAWRRAAAKHLEDFPEPLDALATGLDDPDARVREAWLHAGMRLEDARTTPILAGLLDDPRWRDARVSILEVLAEQGEASTLEPIAALLDARDLRVRRAALAAVQSIRAALEERREVRALIREQKARSGAGDAGRTDDTDETGDAGEAGDAGQPGRPPEEP